MIGLARKEVTRKRDIIKTKLAELDKSVERAKGLTLDEKPNTEDAVTQNILSELKEIEEDMKDVLICEKSKWRFSDLKEDDRNVESIQELNQLEIRIDVLRKHVMNVTLSRRDLGILGELALKSNPSDSEKLSRIASRNATWPSVNGRSVSEFTSRFLQSLSLTDSQLFNWWYSGSEMVEESTVLKDMAKLAGKVVALRARSEELDMHRNTDLEPFQELVNDATVATANLVYLLVDHPNQENELFAAFMLVVRVTFAMSDIVTRGIDTVLSSVKELRPILTNLKDLLITIGGRLVAQPFIAAANDSVLNSSSIPNPSMLIPSEEDNLSTVEADLLVKAGLVENFSVLRRMFSVFTTAKRAKAISMFCSERPIDSAGGKKDYSIQDLVALDLKKIDIDFSKSTFLGRGSYGEIIRHASVDGTRTFAVKKPLNKSSHSGLRTWNRLIREAEVWRRFQHPNICRLQGFCEIPDYPFPGLVMDECIQSIDDYLRTYPASVTEVDQFMLLKDVASGLSHIHGHDCAHGDLRAANILVRRKPTVTGMTAVLSDFGVSDMLVEVGERLSSHSTGQKTNEAWLAPEFFKQKKAVTSISAPADVYAFGCVFLEVLTQREPFDFHDSDQYASFSIRQLKRKKVLPAEGRLFRRPEYYSFMKTTCVFEPVKRPKADVLIDEMEKFGEQVVTSR